MATKIKPDSDLIDETPPGGPPIESPPSASVASWWQDMSDPPTDRPVFLTADPETDTAGTLAYWRTTRVKVQGHKGWQPRSFWAAVLTRRELEFAPVGWREAMPVVPVAEDAA